MQKSLVGTIVMVGAVIAAVSACASNVAGSAASSGQPALASDIVDLSYHGGADAAMSAPLMTSPPTSYVFRTVDDHADPTFNQLLGISDFGEIAGYFGSGAAGHPNKGYRVTDGARRFVAENFPHSVQTQVTAISNTGVTVGFWSAANNANQVNDNTGFVLRHGVFDSVAFPAHSNANPKVNQLLGVNDDNLAVGFYTDAAGNNHGYRYDVARRTFTAIPVPGATSVTAAAINDRDQIAGFDTTSAGATEGFLRNANGSITHLAYPGASMTQAFGVSNRDEAVGSYQVGTGSSAATHGFTWTAKGGFKTVDDPNGVGTTTINGVNDAGVLVGFYVDGAGNTHGLLTKPGPTTNPQPVTERLALSAMPTGTVAVSRTRDGHYHAHVNAFGFTPGSAHLVEIDAPSTSHPIIRFGAVNADTSGVINTTVDSVDTYAALPAGARFVIRLGNSTDHNLVAAETIARSAALPARPDGIASGLTAVEQGASGAPAGTATVTYNPNAHTLAVTINATDLTPGNHAAHIHNGRCQAQGGVRYMLMDYVADA
ncbi:MAG TPA: CHRD domain-containing protein, partial [Pseudonocardiaceae bacterium]